MAATSRRARSPAATGSALTFTERPREARALPSFALPQELLTIALEALHDDDRTGTADARCAAARDYVDDLLECSVVCRRWRAPAQLLLGRLLVLGKPEPFARGNGYSPSLEERFMHSDGLRCKEEMLLLRSVFTHTNLSPFEATLLDNLGAFLTIDEVVGWAPGTGDTRGIRHAHLRDADVASLDLPVMKTLRLDAWDQPPDDTPPLVVPRSLETVESFRVDLHSLVPAPDHAMSLVGRLCAMSPTLRRLRIDHVTLPAVDTLLSTDGVATGGIEELELSIYALNLWTGRTEAAAELLRKTAASMPMRLRKLRIGIVHHHSGWPRRQASVGTFLGPLGDVLAQEGSTLSALREVEVLVDPALPCANPVGELQSLAAACAGRGVGFSMVMAKM